MKYILCFALTHLLISVFAEYSADDCWQLGFNKANLLCSKCNQLSEFQLDILKEHCKECCSPDENPNSVKKYARAVLEVCTCKFGAYPQIAAFIKSDRPNKFPNLKIHYLRGLDPIIKLLNENGDVEETLAIDKWNTDSVEEFLKTHLMSEDEVDYLKTNKI